MHSCPYSCIEYFPVIYHHMSPPSLLLIRMDQNRKILTFFTPLFKANRRKSSLTNHKIVTIPGGDFIAPFTVFIYNGFFWTWGIHMIPMIPPSIPTSLCIQHLSVPIEIVGTLPQPPREKGHSPMAAPLILPLANPARQLSKSWCLRLNTKNQT